MTDYFWQLTGVEPGTRGGRGPLARAVALEEVVWTSLHGPRTPDVVDRILGDDWLSGHLRRLWAEEPPTAELRRILGADAAAAALLSLAPGEGRAVVRGPATWFTGRVAHPIQLPQAHAAASNASPLLARIHDDETDVSVEARGRAGEASIRVTGEAGAADRFVAVELPGAQGPFVVPLRAGRLVATFVCRLADGDVRVGVAEDLMTTLDLPESAEIIRRSVRAADGATQEVWRGLAFDAGEGTVLYLVVAAGLR